MFWTALIFAAGMGAGTQPSVGAGAQVVDAEHVFLRTFWVEYLKKDDLDEVDRRKTREIHPRRSEGAAIRLEKPVERRIPDGGVL